MRRKISIKDLYVKIIAINVGIFLIANILASSNVSFMTTIFAMPIYTSEYISKFWTLLTYQFYHIGFGHVFNNMIILFIFGSLAQRYLGATKMLALYLVGGIVAGMFVILSSTFINYPAGAILLGASGSVFALVVAMSVYMPNHIINLFIFGPVKLKWIAIFLVVLGIVIDYSSNIGGHVAHLGGALFGWLYADQKIKHNDILGGVAALLVKLKIVGNKKAYTSSMYVTKRQNDIKIPKQYKIDKILDKISNTGVESLSKEEKAFLDYQSKK